MNEVKRYMHSDQRGSVEVVRGEYVLYEDYAELKAQLDALAAENTALNEVISAVRGVADNSEGIAGWHLNGDVARWDEILPEIDDIKTPATSAYLNSVLVQGVEMCIASCETCVNSGEYWPPLGSMREIARKLHAGEPS